MEKSRFHFFISGKEKEVVPGSDMWGFPLPLKRTGIGSGFRSELKNRNSHIAIGDYFSASCEFLSGNGGAILLAGLGEHFQKSVAMDEICSVSIFLEKHGAFYHPLKIRVELKDSRTCLFVVNGAVSPPGLSLIENEYALLSRLNKIFQKRYLPRVSGLDVLETPHGRIGFFLGEWFEDYKEFHATAVAEQQQIVIWESDGSCHYLPEKEALPIFREAARILTCYYDIETFEQVFPWHHAAGDFVVRQTASEFQVKLITVRGYSPVTEFDAGETDKKNFILPSLLLFFFNLTLRMRLDRLDGTGKSVMLGDGVIGATIEGFLEALDEKSKDYDYGDLKQSFVVFIKGWGLEQIKVIMARLTESGDLHPSENELVRKNLEVHCRIIHEIFKTS